jgi:hypothetical protein
VSDIALGCRRGRPHADDYRNTAQKYADVAVTRHSDFNWQGGAAGRRDGSIRSRFAYAVLTAPTDCIAALRAIWLVGGQPVGRKLGQRDDFAEPCPVAVGDLP